MSGKWGNEVSFPIRGTLPGISFRKQSYSLYHVQKDGRYLLNLMITEFLVQNKRMERTKVCVRAPDIKHFLIKQPSSKNHSLWSQTFWWEEIFRPNIELWFFLNIQISINPGKSFIFLQSNVIIPRRGCRYFGKEQHQAVFYLGEPFKRPTLLAALFRGP